MKTNGSEKTSIKNKYRFDIFILLFLLLGACTSQTAPTTPSPPPPTAVSVPPTPTPIGPDYWPTEGWRTSTPEEQGMDSELLAEAMNYLQEQNGFNIHSQLIIRNGYVVTDSYFYPFAQSRSLHDLASATNSFTSTLIGIAIAQGYIESVGQPVLDFFPDRSVANVDASGSSTVTVNLSGRLNADASGGSDIYYLGDPDLGEIDTSGSSSIQPR